mmetsp:Transcript_30178/g.63223  ORF Transcript_30178/g.63223 Transcript_30178/m.63223 type:complete len:87 (+) Transcript_30178:140-400(+)|eukprot:CAMPEP_0172172386 /NCGR_PEP_ID=MMETSP1050-20130122/12416_1 /TAXON_ID=233186 /ORGANISM="Cryptomonas curvata, Strain CCAP979/52" /LENGTH=86 /DNA_ID=CAMNT_0012843917 /DNA_START=124 /DNA_END=384 /DNA_ORIENTATION=+
MFQVLLVFTQLGPSPCVVVNGSGPARNWLVKTFTAGRDFMVGMCDKPAGIAAAAAGAKPGAGVEDIDGGMVDVGTDDYAPGGDDEE